jgi:hypothetical protein
LQDFQPRRVTTSGQLIPGFQTSFISICNTTPGPISTSPTQLAMRLLHAKTKILEEFFGDYIPQYAILSHTWGQNEVTFKDVQQYGPFGYKSGSTKIDGCCQQARRDYLEYVWIDTCCIDKSSSAELSEAINSMWSWYQVRISAYSFRAFKYP